MCTIEKPTTKWKAGQCVTIKGKPYRVTKLRSNSGACIFCEFRNKEGDEYPCNECIDRIPNLMPHDCYLQEIKPKS